MTSLDEIPGLDPDLVPVLQTAGIETPADLAVVPAKVIRRAIEKGITGRREVPTIFDVESWQHAVRVSFQSAQAAALARRDEAHRAPEVHAAPEVGAPGYASVDALPVAESLSSRQLMASGISASAVPIARVLGDPSEIDLSEPRMSDEERMERLLHPPPMRPETTGTGFSTPEAEQNSYGGQRSVPERKPVERRTVEPAPRPMEEQDEEEEEERIQVPFPSTEERSREDTDFERKNRGMTHKEPFRVLWGALATILSLILVAIGIGTVVGASVMEFILRKPVPVEMAFGLLAFPSALVIFLCLGTKARCRLCGQRLFMPRSCRKHVRAHRSIFGYPVALAAHVVVRRWFRCSLCGTKQRLK